MVKKAAEIGGLRDQLKRLGMGYWARSAIPNLRDNSKSKSK